eukprot:248636-Rhodomonas_salina.1
MALSFRYSALPSVVFQPTSRGTPPGLEGYPTSPSVLQIPFLAWPSAYLAWYPSLALLNPSAISQMELDRTHSTVRFCVDK